MDRKFHRETLAPGIILVLIAVLASVGCGKKQEVQAASGGAGGRPPAAVVVAEVEQRDIPVQITAIGNIEPYQTVQIRSQVNGQIEKIFFKEGDEVKKGQLLFQLDKRPFQAELEKAVGALQRDQAQESNARSQTERYSALEKQGIVSHELAEQWRMQADSSKANIYADQAAIDAAKVQLQYTDITAPLDARTGALLINVGNLVKANDTPYLVQLNQITPIYATFSVPEAQLPEVRQYYASHLKVLAYPKGQRDNAAEGLLTFIDNGVDTQTGTVKLKATYENRDRRLWPGEFVDVVLNLSTLHSAVLVPTKAIQSGQQGDFVYVVTPQSTAEYRLVQTAGTYQGYTIIKDGLHQGERAIVNGQLRVAPDAKVMVQSTAPSGTPDRVIPAGGTGAGGGTQ
jgi:multidrug efflux system membrane fusion protein